MGMLMRRYILLVCIIGFIVPFRYGVAAPIDVCYTNDTGMRMEFGLSFPANNGVSHTTVQPGNSVRQQGDSDGIYCISPIYFGDPTMCPTDQPNTQAGFQVELQCD